MEIWCRRARISAWRDARDRRAVGRIETRIRTTASIGESFGCGQRNPGLYHDLVGPRWWWVASIVQPLVKPAIRVFGKDTLRKEATDRKTRC
jgi:hypothetical protein